jgi:hypothetical protein
VQREGESKEGEHCEWGQVGSVKQQLGAHNMRRGGRARGKEVRVLGSHGCHVPDARRPLRHSTKHVVGDSVVDVGHIFGLDMCWIGSWAQNKSCSPRNALQFSFKDHGH